MTDKSRLLFDDPTDQKPLLLDAAAYEFFVQALTVTEPGPKLRALVKRVPAWEREAPGAPTD